MGLAKKITLTCIDYRSQKDDFAFSGATKFFKVKQLKNSTEFEIGQMLDDLEVRTFMHKYNTELILVSAK